MNLEALSRKELQALCKEHGIKANQKTAVLVDALQSVIGGDAGAGAAAKEEDQRQVEASERRDIQGELQAKSRRELQDMCKDHGLKAAGKTDALVQRLVEHLVRGLERHPVTDRARR